VRSKCRQRSSSMQRKGMPGCRGSASREPYRFLLNTLTSRSLVLLVQCTHPTRSKAACACMGSGKPEPRQMCECTCRHSMRACMSTATLPASQPLPSHTRTHSPPPQPPYLCVVAQVCLKAKALNDRQVGLDSEDGCAGARQVLQGSNSRGAAQQSVKNARATAES
jgi:hypothetical protein